MIFFNVFTIGVASMDAASFLQAAKSVLLSAAFLSSTVLSDEPPACPLQCKTPCESCSKEETLSEGGQIQNISTRKPSCVERCDGISACEQDASNVHCEACPTKSVASSGCNACEQSVVVAVAKDEKCEACCEKGDELSTCGTYLSWKAQNNPHAVIHFVSDKAVSTAVDSCSVCSESGCASSSDGTQVATDNAKNAIPAQRHIGDTLVSGTSCPHRKWTFVSGRIECSHCSIEKFVETNGVELIGGWAAAWMKGKPRTTARLAIHGVVPDLDLTPAKECGHKKICAGGKCYEVDETTVEGKTCDQSSGEVAEEAAPIESAPVAPPIPTSFQFTDMIPQERILYERGLPDINDMSFEALNETTVNVSASLLVKLLVENAETKTRLAMTQERIEEREAYLESYLALIERNSRLQTLVAALESRQQISDAVSANIADRLDATLQYSYPSDDSVASSEDEVVDDRSQFDTIQEDLANIRRQIALLKRNQPVPFAPSYVGTSTGNPGNPWRGVNATPYVPVAPKVQPMPYTPIAPSVTSGVRRSSNY
jgi:hypothetical protein